MLPPHADEVGEDSPASRTGWAAGEGTAAATARRSKGSAGGSGATGGGAAASCWAVAGMLSGM